MSLFKRHGSSLAFLLVFGSSVGAAFVQSSHAEVAQPIPQPNDLFVVNYSQLYDKPQDYGYSLLKVKAVDANGIQFYLSKKNYNQIQGPVQDIQDKKVQQSDYFSQETIVLKPELLVPLESSHTLYPVKP